MPTNLKPNMSCVVNLPGSSLHGMKCVILKVKPHSPPFADTCLVTLSENRIRPDGRIGWIIGDHAEIEVDYLKEAP